MTFVGRSAVVDILGGEALQPRQSHDRRPCFPTLVIVPRVGLVAPPARITRRVLPAPIAHSLASSPSQSHRAPRLQISPAVTRPAGVGASENSIWSARRRASSLIRGRVIHRSFAAPDGGRRLYQSAQGGTHR